MKKLGILLLPLILLLFPALVEAKIVVINSKNWEDVYSGILYANFNSYHAYFTNSPNPTGLLNILPKDKVILIQTPNPYIPNLQTILENKGYEVEVKQVKDANLELIPQVKNFILVEKDLPTYALLAASLSKVKNAWVLLVDPTNLNTILPKLKDGKEVVLVGYFKREIYSKLKPYATQELISTNKFELSKEIAQEFLNLKKVNQALITDGKSLEEEVLRGNSPILLVGTNYLPKGLVDFLLENNFKSVVVIGSHLTYIGEQIRQKSNKQIAVFVKFGQALPGTPVYSLSFFPLPLQTYNLTILKVYYSPLSKTLFITYKNLGEVGTFVLTTFRILDGEEEIASGGDVEAFFLGKGEVLSRSYEVEIPAERLTKNLTVELFTSYGESPENLDLYLTQSGRFGPPLTLKLEIENVEDRSNLTLKKVTYYKGYKRIGIKVENLGEVKAYFVAKLIDLKVKGIKQSFASEVSVVLPKSEREVFIPVELDKIDLLENEIVKVEIDYGEREDLLIKSETKEMKLAIEEGFPLTGLFLQPVSWIGIIIALVVIIVLFKFFFRMKRKKKRKRK